MRVAATPAPMGPGLPYRDPNADDARHSVLSKARAVSQTSLGAFLSSQQPLLPRDDFGRYEVREIDAKSALTKCAMPGEPWALNPYMGCSHDCAYCYVPDVAHVQRERWGSYVLVKRNLPRVLAEELRRKEPRPVFLSSATDPYQPVEGTHRITERCLEQLVRADWPLRVLTRNPLVKRDARLFAQFTDLEVGMSVPTLDDDARRLVEPGAPSIEGRLRALRALADEGLRPTANLAPLFPLSGGVKPSEVAAAFRDAGVVTVYAAAWRYLDTVLPVLRQRVAGAECEAIERAVQDPAYYARLFRQLKAAFRGSGVELVVMGETPARRGRYRPAQ